MNKYKTIEETPIFKQAHSLTLEVYKLTESFPKSEVFGLTSQLRRAASSIPANIAEGFGRKSTKVPLQFIYNARGSYQEVHYHLLLAKDLGLIPDDTYNLLKEKYDQVGKQLNGWIKSIKLKIND